MSHIPSIGQPAAHPGRLEALEETGLLDSLEEESYDRYTRLVRSLLGVEISLVTLVAEDRQFFKSQSGLGEPLRSRRENDISYSFCRFVVEGGQAFVVEDASSDPRVMMNPAITELGVMAYLGMPITTPDGYVLGSLCAVGTEPRKWSPADLRNLADLAKAVTREIELSEQTTALKQAVELSEKGRRNFEQHVRNIIHDLRSPAAAISSCLRMLANTAGVFSEEDKELIEISRESAKQVIEMTNQALEMDRTSALQGTHLDLQPVSASLLIRRAARLIRPFANDAGIRLDIDRVEELVFLKADEDLIGRVLINLLTNAVKYSPQGEIIKVRIQRHKEGGAAVCRISVSDHGPGIPEEEKNLIFNPFATGSRPGGGSPLSFGIGLSFCKTTVESHGGRIGVTDAPEGGSTFFCLLPEWS